MLVDKNAHRNPNHDVQSNNLPVTHALNVDNYEVKKSLCQLLFHTRTLPCRGLSKQVLIYVVQTEAFCHFIITHVTTNVRTEENKRENDDKMVWLDATSKTETLNWRNVTRELQSGFRIF